MQEENYSPDSLFKSFFRIKHQLPSLINQHGLNFNEFIALQIISKHPKGEDINLNTFIEPLHINKSAVSQMIRSLENRGYITRMQSEHDRRKITLDTTEKTHNIIKDLEDYHVKMSQKIYDQMGKEKFENLIVLLTELGDIISIYKNELEERG